MSNKLNPAKYFPVSEKPLTMKSGLHDFGTDFGNGPRELLFFQQDKLAGLYRKCKELVPPERHWCLCDSEEQLKLHQKAFPWLISRQEQELNVSISPDLLSVQNQLLQGEKPDLTKSYHRLSLNVQEDIALIADQPDSSLIMGHISMPSFWDPKKIKGASFCRIHEPVPNFPKNEQISKKLNRIISTKGPFVRFVWTIANDERLDHHPENGRTAWKNEQPLWLRVERQITVPFEGLGALFLIRTYLYPINTLNKTECRTLSLAIENMPRDIAVYKGLWEGKELILNYLSEAEKLREN